MKRTSKRRVLKKWARHTILFIIFVLILSGSLLIYKGFYMTPTDEKSTVLFNNHISQTLDYSVNLNKNSFIKETTLGKDQTYISDLIKTIDLHLIYQFSSKDKHKYTYSYEVDADINGRYTIKVGEDESEVWNDPKKLILTKSQKIESNNVVINEKMSINFKEFDNKVTEFRKELNLPITAELDVVVKINISDEEGTINDTQKLALVIPLNQQAFKITSDFKPEVDVPVYKEQEYKMQINNKNLIAGIIVIIVGIFIFVIFFKEIFNLPIKTLYTVQLAKILKSYGDIIIELASTVDLSEFKVIDVKNFNEMLDLEEELHVPINFYEVEEYYEGQFYIIQSDIAYRYTLSNDILEKEKL